MHKVEIYLFCLILCPFYLEQLQNVVVQWDNVESFCFENNVSGLL